MTTLALITGAVALVFLVLIAVSIAGALGRIADMIDRLNVTMATQTAVQMAYLAHADDPKLQAEAQAIALQATIQATMREAGIDPYSPIKVEHVEGEVEK